MRTGTGLILWMLAVAGFAQDKPVIPPVDLGRAQNLVDTLTRENETLRADSERLRTQAEALRGRVIQAKKWLADLTALLDEIKGRNGDLATLAQTLVDRGLKARSAAAAEKNKALEKQVAQRIQDLGNRIAEWTKLADQATFQAEVNEAKLTRNDDDIIVLQATLSKTRIQETQLTALVDEVNGLASRVETLLTQSTPAAP